MCSLGHDVSRSPDALEAFDRFLASEPLPGRHRLASQRTRQAYLRGVRLFVAWFCQTNGLAPDAFTPDQVTREDVRDYLAALRARHAAVATIRHRHAALSAFFKWARSQDLTPADPTEGISLPTRQTLAPQGLDRRQRRALLRALNALPHRTPAARRRAVRDRALVLTLLYVGLRVSEVAALRLDDLDLRERSGAITVRSAKGDKDRTAAVPLEARKALQAWLDVRPTAAHDFVFLRSRRPYAPLGVRAVQEAVQRVGRLAGLENVTPHRLRHTAVYMWREKGVDPFVIAAQFGHQSLTTTMRYGRPRLSDLQQAAEKFE